MRVNEIFYSLQGEGAHTGTAAIFIRLSGCNLACPFCDTEHQTYEELSREDILQAIVGYGARHLVFTGGEPALQLDEETVRFFKQQGYFIQVETNGTINMPFPDIDWVTCSPKSDYCRNAVVRQERIDEVKVVFDGKNNPEKFLSLPARVHLLQPCDVGHPEENEKIRKQCVEYILSHPQWRLSLQTHKLLNIR